MPKIRCLSKTFPNDEDGKRKAEQLQAFVATLESDIEFIGIDTSVGYHIHISVLNCTDTVRLQITKFANEQGYVLMMEY